MTRMSDISEALRAAPQTAEICQSRALGAAACLLLDLCGYLARCLPEEEFSKVAADVGVNLVGIVVTATGCPDDAAFQEFSRYVRHLMLDSKAFPEND